MYTKGQLSEFWDAILMSSTSKNVLQKFTRNLMGPSNAKKGADGYTYYATWTDFFLDNMISPNYFENMFVQTYGTVDWWLEKCGICFAIFLFPKLIIDIIVTVMRTSEVHLITGISVSFEKKVLQSATYNLFMVSILNSIIPPTKIIENSAAAATETQEPMEDISFIQTQPNNAPDTVSPV